MTVRTHFHEALKDLKGKLLVMGDMAGNAAEQAVSAFNERSPELCRDICEAEIQINIAEREIDKLALDLLAKQQPMAVDLRFIIAVIKSNADLERIGDLAVNISERVMALIQLPPVEFSVDIPAMAALVSEMIRQSLQAFASGDVEAAQRVLEQDEQVDRMNHEIFTAIDRTLETDPHLVRQAMHTMSIARLLERIADHATNIAEDAVFWVCGADVRRHFGQTA